MATTQNTFTGDGSNLGPFSFTFKWLEPTDIKVTVAGVLKTVGTHYNLQSLNYSTKTGGQVLFTAGNAPANNAAIVVYRQTDDSALASTFYSGSAIRAQDLNDNFTQNLYVTQEANNISEAATTTAGTALTNSNTAISTANTALSTANTASSNASAAVATANTANTNASAAVSTANTANTNASAAVATANAANTTANTASTNASSALTAANNAVSTANTASTNASAAVSTANTAAANASTALSTANTASTNASSAVTTANTASTNSSTAISTANSALTTANAAAAAVATAILYTTVANVAGIPASPSNNAAIEVVNSTGIESFTPLNGLPVGFVGSSGLSVRLVYTSSGSTWNWIQYFPNDPETRYLKLSGGTLTGQLRADDSTSTSVPVYSFDGDANTGVAHTGPDQLALVTGGTSRLAINSTGDLIAYGGFSGPGVAVTSFVVINDDAVLAFVDKVNTQYSISIEPASGATANATYVLPATVGTSGQLLGTSGSGALVWTNPVNISGKLDITTAASTYAPLANPSFTGTVTIPAGASIAGYLPTSGGTLTGNVSFASTQTFPRIPANPQTASYTLVASDAGKHVSITTGGVTVPSGVFATGDVISIYNNSGTSQTITQGASVTLRLAGTSSTGNRTLDGYGLATLVCVATNTFVIAGAGVS